MKKLIRAVAKKLGYTYSVVRLTPDEVSGKPSDLVGDVCRKNNVPFCATVESPDQFPDIKPLFPKPTPARLPKTPLTHYKGLQDALVDNISVSRYFKAETRGDDVVVSDPYPEKSYLLRQKMIFAGLTSALDIADLSGLSVLDIGCSCGYFTFAAGQMGAREVLGIDARPEHADQFAILQSTRPDLPVCRYRMMDMENDLEKLTEPFDIVYSMGVMYHTFDHVRFARNMYRLTGKALYLAGACSGRADRLCDAVIEDKHNLRASVHGPALFPSLPWMMDILRYVGFSKVYYQRWPSFQPDAAGCDKLESATLVAVK